MNPSSFFVNSLYKLDLTFDEEIKHIQEWCKKNIDFALVRTKYNKQKRWTAISIIGYSSDPLEISKPSVLGAAEVLGDLQETHLAQEFDIQKVLDKFPGRTDRVRLMKLEKESEITKHTDKVDKDIKGYKILRLHIPVVTNDRCYVFSWPSKNDTIVGHMKTGECWYLDVSKAHAVQNAGKQDRVHLVVDVENNAEVRELFGATRGPLGF